MDKIPELYFRNDEAWRNWLREHHETVPGVYLIFYQVSHPKASMRWEEAVKVALCYGWIDSTVKSLGEGKRRQYFCPRKPNSVWSKLNKLYLEALAGEGLIHESGMAAVAAAKANGSWYALDDVEEGKLPADLEKAFEKEPLAFENFKAFSFTYRKSYLYWLQQAKRKATRETRILEILRLCKANIKLRQ